MKTRGLPTVSSGWLCCPSRREEEPRVFTSESNTLLNIYGQGQEQAGLQTFSGSYLVWCPQYVNCGKGKGKKTPTHLFYYSSALFYLCMTYCSLVGVEKTLVKIKCTFLKFILAQFCLHQKFKKIMGNGFTCHSFFTLGRCERICVPLKENFRERKKGTSKIYDCVLIYTYYYYIFLYFSYKAD